MKKKIKPDQTKFGINVEGGIDATLLKRKHIANLSQYCSMKLSTVNNNGSKL